MMPPTILFIFAWVVSVVGTVLLGAVAVTYIRRTWQLIRAEEDDPTRERLLDGIDHLENQMHLIGERLGSLEERLTGMERRLKNGSTTALPPSADAPSPNRHPTADADPGHDDGSAPEARHP